MLCSRGRPIRGKEFWRKNTTSRTKITKINTNICIINGNEREYVKTNEIKSDASTFVSVPRSVVPVETKKKPVINHVIMFFLLVNPAGCEYIGSKTICFVRTRNGYACKRTRTNVFPLSVCLIFLIQRPVIVSRLPTRFRLVSKRYLIIADDYGFNVIIFQSRVQNVQGFGE